MKFYITLISTIVLLVSFLWIKEYRIQCGSEGTFRIMSFNVWGLPNYMSPPEWKFATREQAERLLGKWKESNWEDCQ